MTKTLKQFFGLSSFILMLGTGCGANTDNIDILDSSTIPELSNFVASGTNITGQLSAAFSSAQPYWSFNNLSAGYGGSYLSPAKGIVGEIGTSTIPGSSGSFVTIIHSGRLATRLYGISSLSVRSGDVVVAGGLVGVFFGTGTQGFQVFLDGTSVCPLSFISSAFRQSFTSFAVLPCQ